MSIHEHLKRRREELKLSMEDLAAMISEAEGLQKPLAWQTIQQWENGKSAPRRGRMQIVAKILQTTVQEMVGEVAGPGGQAANHESTPGDLLQRIVSAFAAHPDGIRLAAAELVAHAIRDPECADSMALKLDGLAIQERAAA